MELIAICTGVVSPLTYRTGRGELRTIASGINKTVQSDLSNNKRIEVRKLGLAGDEQCDLSLHGGLDKAVYMMPSEHYAFWNEQRMRHQLPGDLPWGFLGENLVLSGLLEHQVHLGDEFQLGEVVFRVTAPREPCHKFAIKMGYATAPKQMIQKGNCGWYLRVLETGHIHAGQTLTHLRNSQAQTVEAQFQFLTRKGQMSLL